MNTTDQNKVIEGNRIIAEFMGLTQGRPNEIRWKHDWFDDKGAINGQRNTHLHFNTSWDWLMPVVEKIEQTEYSNALYGGTWCVMIFDNSCAITEFPNALFGKSIPEQMAQRPADVQADTKLNATYKAVVEFIQWYNSQTEQK